MRKISKNSVLSYTKDYLTIDGKPWFPVMGEMHYSRVDPVVWERELLKVKAGGVEVISTYVIWIHHEEQEGVYDFTGCRDLRAFLALIKKCGLYCVLRIGPWVHAEVRNGGFPDWLMRKAEEGEAVLRSDACADGAASDARADGAPAQLRDGGADGRLVLRSDNAHYLYYVCRFYEKIYEQAEGMFIAQGGPVIGVQIENEYGHCGGLTGEAGEAHMRTLLRLAKEIGFKVPLYTATGWGGAVTGGMIPVMGGYCEAPWDQRVTEIEPSGNYIFTEERDDHGIGSDYGIGEGLTFDMHRFPYLTAELGGGLQVTAHRRPVAHGRDIAAMSMVKLGSGCNLLGYYMYHGGTNPKGKLSTLQESRATGYPNDLPELSYDFNAPVREYGQLTDTWRRIRMLAMFVRDYEDILCRTEYIGQPGNPAHPEDLTSLRTAVRVDPATGGGFFFVNNYQRRYAMAEHRNVALRANVLADFGTHTVRDGAYFFWPFKLRLGGALLEYATAIPLCILRKAGQDGRDVYVFYTEGTAEAEYVWNEGGVDCGGADCDMLPQILTLTEEEALHACKVSRDGRDYLMISDGDIVEDANGEILLYAEVSDSAVTDVSIRVFPDDEAIGKYLRGFAREESELGRLKVERSKSERATEERSAAEESMSVIRSAVYRYPKHLTNTVKAEVVEIEEGRWRLHVELPEAENLAEKLDLKNPGGAEPEMGQEDAIVSLSFDGNCAKLMVNGELAADQFYTGQAWEIGVNTIRRRMHVEGACLDAEVCVEPLYENAEVFLETKPEFIHGKACAIREVRTRTISCVK